MRPNLNISQLKLSTACQHTSQHGHLSDQHCKARTSTSPFASAQSSLSAEEAYTWPGSDEFTQLNDRKDLPPVDLPELTKFRRVVLVRHGQSTWNASGRIQGCSDFSELTLKGQQQAQTTREMLSEDKFDILFNSPLKRASQTADIIWGQRSGPREVLPSLREIDLYSFQGLYKEKGKELYGSEFLMWQRQASKFEIDGHAPIRELWHRASLAWNEILTHPLEATSSLVVAHNAVNQALICTAVGLEPTFFRRFLQSNAATTVIDFEPALFGSRVTINRVNQAPNSPFDTGAGRATSARIVLLRHGATAETEGGFISGDTDLKLSTLGEAQAQKCGEAMIDLAIAKVFSSPTQRCRQTADVISKAQMLGAYVQPSVEVMDDLSNFDPGSWKGKNAGAVKGQQLPEDAELPAEFIDRMKGPWQRICQEADANGGQCVLVVGHAMTHNAFLNLALGLPPEQVNMFKSDVGGLTVLDMPDGATKGNAIVRAVNFTAHLGQWAVPVTQNEVDIVCGIDGCF